MVLYYTMPILVITHLFMPLNIESENLNKDFNVSNKLYFRGISNKIILKDYTSIIFALILSVLLCCVLIFSYTKIYQTINENLIHTTEDKIALISKNTNSFLQKAKTLVLTNAASVEYLFEKGVDNNEILEYLLYLTDSQLAKIDKSFTGVYGYYRGEYLDGNRWDPYANGGVYYPKERPWYISAIEGKREVSIASPYLDLDTGNVILSVTKLLSDGESVFGLDVNLVNLSNYVNEYLAANDFNYAYIIDSFIFDNKVVADIRIH